MKKRGKQILFSKQTFKVVNLLKKGGVMLFNANICIIIFRFYRINILNNH